jgi:hypothetical protein
MPAKPFQPFDPPFRRLRGYAFDPSLSNDLDTAVLNAATFKVKWEQLTSGPIGEYLEVVDYDPASGAFYEPVNLDNPKLLAQDGLPPSEGVPQFHQQMVYAVAMTTIAHFERALGRKVLWAQHFLTDKDGERVRKENGEPDVRYVPRLRIYPHALREANAYYSPQKKSLLFGYFPASVSSPGHNLPGGIVFTCLSHDIVAHETTHAILDGLHRRFVEDSNPDALAFHEAFADLVALFQHFTFAESLRHQIARTRGDLGRQNLLGELAQQFGQAIGQHGALRSAITLVPDPKSYETTTEPHDRGAILVAAVFDAFLSIYKTRIADLLRIYTGGTGVLPQGEIHPDLVNRLSAEASKAASHVLQMCIRATDYCPPIDVTFGDYLRALITADEDLVPDDDLNYRLAFVEAFRRRGIYPTDVRSLSVDSLRWAGVKTDLPIDRMPRLQLGVARSRRDSYERSRQNGQVVWSNWLKGNGVTFSPDALDEMGLQLHADAPKTIERSRVDGLPKVEVHSVRPARRAGPDGQLVSDIVVEITQKRWGYFDSDVQANEDAGKSTGEKPDFIFRGGCTLLIDMAESKARYCIAKNIGSKTRLERHRKYLTGADEQSLRKLYFRGAGARTKEPFAMLHRDY